MECQPFDMFLALDDAIIERPLTEKVRILAFPSLLIAPSLLMFPSLLMAAASLFSAPVVAAFAGTTVNRSSTVAKVRLTILFPNCLLLFIIIPP